MEKNDQSPNTNQPLSDQPQDSFEFGADTTAGNPSPTMDTSMETAQPIASAKKPSKKKWFWIGGGAVVVLLIIGLVAGYFWYQSPNKVVSDSVMHLVSLKKATLSGSLSATSKDYKIVASFDGGSNENREGKANATLSITANSGEMKGKAFKIEGSFVATKDGTIYLQAKDLQQLVTTYVDTMTQTYVSEGLVAPSQLNELKAQIHAQLDPVVKKIDGQWIKISPSDLDSDDNDKSTQCVQDTIKALQDDKNMQNDLQSVYTKNQFITITKNLGLKDGSYGYELSYDKAKAKDFGKAVKDTEFGKKLSSCDDSEDTSGTDDAATDDSYTTTFQLWVSQWSHQITRVKVDGQPKDSGTDPVILMDVTMDAGKSTSVQAPSNAKSFKDLENEFNTLSPMASGV